jgi:hypothetical protein
VRLGMKHVLVSFSLALVAVFAPNTPIRVDDVAMRTAIPSTLNCMPSTETNHQREVHAVVVDMPQRASLEFASPDTWGALPTSDPPDEEFLPTFDPPDEEFPTKSATQVALN